MHPRIPRVSGPDGVATPLYKMGQEDWLGQFLNVRGADTLTLVDLRRDVDISQQLYRAPKLLTLSAPDKGIRPKMPYSQGLKSAITDKKIQRRGLNVKVSNFDGYHQIWI